MYLISEAHEASEGACQFNIMLFKVDEADNFCGGLDVPKGVVEAILLGALLPFSFIAST